MLVGGLRPGPGIGQGELTAVAARAPHRPRLYLIWGGVEGAVRMQPHQHVGAAAFQAALELDGIVAGVEDEHGRGTLVRQAAQQIPHQTKT